MIQGSIHTAARTLDMGPVSDEIVGEFDPRVRNFATTPGVLRVHHVRRTSPLFDNETFHPLRLTPELVSFWLRLARKMASLAPP